jgi:hypothetical protein
MLSLEVLSTGVAIEGSATLTNNSSGNKIRSKRPCHWLPKEALWGILPSILFFLVTFFCLKGGHHGH